MMLAIKRPNPYLFASLFIFILLFGFLPGVTFVVFGNIKCDDCCRNSDDDSELPNWLLTEGALELLFFLVLLLSLLRSQNSEGEEYENYGKKSRCLLFLDLFLFFSLVGIQSTWCIFGIIYLLKDEGFCQENNAVMYYGSYSAVVIGFLGLLVTNLIILFSPKMTET